MRCTGHCCRLFILEGDYGYFQSSETIHRLKDGQFIADMLIPLEVECSKPGYHYYTCKHFDGQNCTQYENRPHFCKSYPDDSGICSVKGCTAECAGKNGTLTYFIEDEKKMEEYVRTTNEGR